LAGEEIVRTDDADPPGDKRTLDGLREVVGPEGETVAVMETLPERPLMLVIVRLELDAVPIGILREPGLAEMLKSTTCTVTWTECVREPLVAVMVTV